MEVEIKGVFYKTGKMKVDDLRKELTRRGADAKGQRKDLQYRLEQLIRDDNATLAVTANAAADDASNDRISTLESQLTQVMQQMTNLTTAFHASTAATTTPAVVQQTPCLPVSVPVPSTTTGAAVVIAPPNPHGTAPYAKAKQKILSGEYVTLAHLLPGSLGSGSGKSTTVFTVEGVDFQVPKSDSKTKLTYFAWHSAVSRAIIILLDAGKVVEAKAWASYTEYIDSHLGNFSRYQNYWMAFVNFDEAWRQRAEANGEPVWPAHGSHDETLSRIFNEFVRDGLPRVTYAGGSPFQTSGFGGKGKGGSRDEQSPGGVYTGVRSAGDRTCDYWNAGRNSCYYTANCVEATVFDHRCDKCGSKGHRGVNCPDQKSA